MSRKKKEKDEIITFTGKPKYDYQQFLDYVLDTIPPHQVEQIFKYRQKLLTEKHYTEEQTAMHLLRMLASPENVPPEVWISLDEVLKNRNGENVINEETSEDDDEFDPRFDPNDLTGWWYLYRDEDYDEDYDEELDDTFPRVRTGTHSDAAPRLRKIIRLGGSFEYWSADKYRCAGLMPAEEVVMSDLMNKIELYPFDVMQQRMDQTKYIYFDRLGIDEIRQSVPIDTEAIVMDPPLGPDDITIDELTDIFTFFKNELRPPVMKRKRKKPFVKELFHEEEEDDDDKKKDESCTFILIWANPEDFTLIDGAAFRANLYYCEMIAVELLDDTLNRYSITSKRGFINHSKTIIMYRTLDRIKSYRFAHQKNKDIGNGACKPQGRSRGRLGTPQFAHQIVEGMLPNTSSDGDSRQRVFVELWPTRLSPRPNWIIIDEKC